MKFISKDGSVAFVYFRKRGDEYAFAMNVREFKFGGEKTGLMYFTPNRIVFDSDDNKDRSFDISKDDAKLRTERGHGGRWFNLKVAGKEKRFMVSFAPPRPLGKQQDPVFDLIERLMTIYSAVLTDFQQQVAKLAQPSQKLEPAENKTTSPQASTGEPTVVIDIGSEPSGSEIYVDSVFSGSTPSKLSLSIGEHSIRVTRPGFKDWERKIVVDGKSTKTLNAILEKN
jgi:hypothetical protein